MGRHAIAPERVVGHACVAPGRKRDPGEKLDWRRLALRGLSVWDFDDGASSGASEVPADALRFQAAARLFGYAVPDSAEWCGATLAVWRAFAMRFQPPRAGEAPTATGLAMMERLAARWPVAQEA
jgi:N-acetylmuramoyl-L-alanine amidase